MTGIKMDSNKMKKLTKSSNGFTLVELIVVMAVLLFVVGTAIGIFISIVQHQKVILSEQELLNQTSFVVERMSKALRVAKKDSTGECLGSGYIGHNYLLTRPNISTGAYTGIKFINQSDNDACQEFYLYTDNSDPEHTITVLKELKDSTNDSQAVALTSDRLMINSLRFGINGEDGSTTGSITDDNGDNNIQSRITIFLDIQTSGGDNPSIEKIQTTISQRDLNVPQ